MDETSGLAIWVILPAVFLIYFALTVVLPTALVRSGGRLSRKSFAVRYFSVLGAAFVLGGVIGIAKVVNDRNFDERFIYGIFGGLAPIGAVLRSYWSAQRAQDIGWTKWWNLLYGIPLMNLVYLCTMLFVGSAEAQAQDSSPSGEAALAED